MTPVTFNEDLNSAAIELATNHLYRKQPELYGEEDVIEDSVDRVEERGDKPTADQEENNQAEHPHAVVELGCFVGQKVAEDVAAIERGERNQVEDEEQQVDEDDEVEKERDGEECRKAFGGDAGNMLGDGDGGDDGDVSGWKQMLDDDQQDERDGGGEQVAGWTGEGDEDVVAAVVLEVATGDGCGLGPTDEEASVDQRDERKEHRADGIEVLQWVEGDATEHHGGGIAKAHGGPGVGALMHAEGED